MSIARDLGRALEGEQVRVFWPEDPGAPEPGPGVIVLRWEGQETPYYAPDIEGPDWLEQRRRRFGA